MYSHTMNDSHMSTPTADVDPMLYDVSNQLARAQLSRQISNTSSTFRQRAARIFKPNSAGNSPQNIQRRRTSASQRPTRYRSELYSNHVPVLRHGLPQSQEHLRRVPAARPVSWHPSSVSVHRASACSSSYYPPSRQSIAECQDMTANHHSHPMPQSYMGSNNPMDQRSSMDGSMFSYQSSAMGLFENNSVGYDLDTSYRSCVGFDSTRQEQFPNIPPAAHNPNLSNVDYSTQTWAESLSTFPSYTNPPTPEFLPIQFPGDAWHGLMGNVNTHLPKKQSKELVGMGLYDSPNRENFEPGAAINQSFGGRPVHSPLESTGKGLKLEETWQPPEEGDASEVDEEEQEDDDDCQNLPTDANHTTQLGPEVVAHLTYSNLSDQSFFFDNDEMYYDSIAVNQGIPGMVLNMQGGFLQPSTWV